MTALYAYYRLTDDLADQPAPLEQKRHRLVCWRTRLLAPHPSHRIHAALRSTVERYQIPLAALTGVIDGAERDLDPAPFRTLAEVDQYCDQVAGTVGIASLCVWGFRHPSDRAAALELALRAGRAFQRTNILRDLAEDRAMGRIYLAQEEWERFGCPPESWHPANTAWQALFQAEVERARADYQQAAALPALLGPDGQAIWHAMQGLYHQLLEAVAARGPTLEGTRIRLSRRTKLTILARAWPARWGWSRP
jgi:phytoene synthase